MTAAVPRTPGAGASGRRHCAPKYVGCAPGFPIPGCEKMQALSAPWCEQRGMTCPGVRTIRRLIARRTAGLLICGTVALMPVRFSLPGERALL